MTSTDWTGQTVRFTTPLEDGEAEDRMTVLEDRDDCVLVRSDVYCTEWTFRPTSVYRKSDLTLTA